MQNHFNKILLLVVLLVSATFVYGKDPTPDKVTLRTGEVYIGQILVRNNEIVTLKTPDGNRFQFPAAEVLKIEAATQSDLDKKPAATVSMPEEMQPEGNICGLAEFSAGMARATNKFGLTPVIQGTLSFGTRLIKGKNLFGGAGVGYLHVLSSAEPIGFIPVFLRLRGAAERKKLSPYVCIDGGYSFATNEETGGGLYARTAIGMQVRKSKSTLLSLGFFGFATNFSSQLTESTLTGEYHYDGGTSLYGIGITAGIQF